MADLNQTSNPKKIPWYRTTWGILSILVTIFVISFILAFAFYINRRVNQIATENQAKSAQAELEQNKTLINGLNPYYLGTTTPKITIVEFGDFACPYCYDSFTAVRDLAALYPDKVKIVWRDFLGHEDSLGLALAARCAGEQGKFWEMHDGLFLHQGDLSEENIVALATKNNLDITQFNDCLSQKKYASSVAKDQLDASRLGVTGTPTWFVNNGYRIEGALGLDNLKTIVEKLDK